MRVGDKIRIKPINIRGFALAPASIDKHGDVFIISGLSKHRRCFEIGCKSVKTGCSFSLTEDYYKIEVLYDYVPVVLPDELFEIRI